jgi:dihydropteroate synthase
MYLFLKQKKAELLEAGIKDIIVDPGFGFGKISLRILNC